MSRKSDYQKMREFYLKRPVEDNDFPEMRTVRPGDEKKFSCLCQWDDLEGRIDVARELAIHDDQIGIHFDPQHDGGFDRVVNENYHINYV